SCPISVVLADDQKSRRQKRAQRSPRRRDPLEQPKQVGVTDVVPLHHQVYPRLRDRYPFAIVLIAAPFVLKLAQSEPVAMWLWVGVGVAALLLPALTDHPTGLVRSIPYWLHLWVDRAVGSVFVIAPFAFKFAGLDAWYYWVLAAGVLLSTSVFNAPEEPVVTRSGLDMRTAG